MERTNMIVRIILGLLLVFFGLNGFLRFLPLPEPSSAAADAGAGMAKAIYIMPEVMTLLIVTGILLLANRYTSLALLMLFPMTVNFVLFHIFLDISGIVPGLILFLMNVYLIYTERSKYLPLLE